MKDWELRHPGFGFLDFRSHNRKLLCDANPEEDKSQPELEWPRNEVYVHIEEEGKP